MPHRKFLQKSLNTIYTLVFVGVLGGFSSSSWAMEKEEERRIPSTPLASLDDQRPPGNPYKVTVISLPHERRFFNLDRGCPQFEAWRLKIDKLIDMALARKIPQPTEKMTDLTLDEARRYFFSYVQDDIGSRDPTLEFLFTQAFFGPTYTQQEIIVGESQYRKEMYTFSCLGLLIRAKEQLQKPRADEEKGKKLWDCGQNELANKRTLADHFLTPAEAAKDFTNYQRISSFGNPIRYEEAIQFTDIFNADIFYGPPPIDPQERRKYFLKHSLGFLDSDLILSIYTTAHRIMTLTEKGDRIVIFGNTPAFIGRVLTNLIESDRKSPTYRQLIKFPFSGTPKGIRTFSQPLDIVTKERYAHLLNRMALEGLTPDNADLFNGTTHFVDVVGAGGGIAYLTETLLQEVREKGRPYPNLHVITLNKINRASRNRNGLIAKKDADDGESVEFHFPSIEDTHFIVPGTVVYLPGHIKLDELPSQEWRIVPEYNAFYWQSCFDPLLEDISEHTKILLDYFDTRIQQLGAKKE